jgi:hypothetical protein
LNNGLAAEIRVAIGIILESKIILQGEESALYPGRDSSIQEIRSLEYLLGFVHNNWGA